MFALYIYKDVLNCKTLHLPVYFFYIPVLLLINSKLTFGGDKMLAEGEYLVKIVKFHTLQHITIYIY